ncbi:MAG TPA: aldehyde dehydrogenase family protein [Solirubrobacteraceae bacterium]|nr:aldehyde dehydrogenase family protein [Solirubrobacteraceae bacterium]
MTETITQPDAPAARPQPAWTLDLSIAGVPVAGRGEPVVVFDPATEAELTSLPQADPEQVEHAIVAARRAFDDGPWPRMSLAGRAGVMHRFADRLEERAHELVTAIVYECGTPITQTQIGQVELPIAILRSYADLARKDRTEYLGPNFEMTPSDSLVAYQPVGVVGVITAYNFPLVLALRTIGGALAAGCTVVVAPSPKAPLSTLMAARAAEEAGFPPGVVNVVVGGSEVGRVISTHKAVDKVGFTGSRNVGQIIMEQAASTIKGVMLELGGKTPTLVMPGVDAARIARRLHTKYLLNAGQACAAPARILIPREEHERFVHEGRKAYGGIKVGDPWDPKTIVGPLIGPDHREHVERVVQDAVSEGATILAGGGRPPLERGWYTNPVLVGGVDNRAPIAQEEIFGPVGVLIPYDGIDDGVAKANDVVYGLAADVFSPDAASGIAIARRLRAGTVTINGGGAFRPDAPFGGLKASGIGREYGEWGVREFLEPQHVQWALR